MINVSSEFKTLMNERTDFKFYAEVTLLDDTELILGNSNLCIDGNKYIDAFESNTFPIGLAACKEIQIHIMNDTGTYSNYDFFGAEIDLYLKFELSATTESIYLGKYTVTSPVSTGDVIEITAYDNMWKANKEYTTNLNFQDGVTVSAVFQDACQGAGLLPYSLVFPNSSTIVYNKPKDTTFREVIGYCAMVAGGNARIRRTGEVEVVYYHPEFTNAIADEAVADLSIVDDSSVSSYHVLTNWIDLNVDTDDIVVTGVEVVNETDNSIVVGEDGYIIKVNNQLFFGDEETLANLIVPVINKISIRKFNGSYIAYPIAEIMDNAIITDRKNNSYYTVITDIEFNLNGVTHFENSSDAVISHGGTYTSRVSDVVRKSRYLVRCEQTARESSYDALTSAIATSSGMFVSTKQLEDGSFIYYLHDKNDEILSNDTFPISKYIIKLTSQAIGFSTDGGSTYPYGFTITGEIVARLLAAEGVNADWITSGAITIEDDDGHVVFSVDKDNESVFINGDVVRINNQMLPAKINEVMSNAYSEIQTAKDELTEDYNEIKGYIRYENGTIIIGMTNFAGTWEINATQLSAKWNGQVISYWNQNEQYTPKQLTIPVGGSLRLGNYQWTPRSSGNLSLLWVGTNNG